MSIHTFISSFTHPSIHPLVHPLIHPSIHASGIIRDSSCTLDENWNAYKCGGAADNAGPEYEMMMLESMDADWETRRVSPVAVFGKNDDDEVYVDLINGPMDHGWCSGYTCQKRISLFPVLVTQGKHVIATLLMYPMNAAC